MAAPTTPPQSFARVVYRFLVGRPLDGVYRTDAGFLRPGRKALTGHGHASRWAMLPGWKRAAVRLGTLAATVATAVAYRAYAQVTVVALGGAAAVGAVYAVHRLRRWWRLRRFRAVYIRPTLAALTGALGNARVRLHVSPELGNLVVRLAKPMSPAEKSFREWYGARVEPVLRWAPDRLMRCWWAVKAFASPLVGPLTTWLRRPQDGDSGPRIHLQTSVPYLTPEQRLYAAAVIGAKIPAGELTDPRWDQVGTQVNAVWTVRRRPPTRVGYADLDARLPSLKEWEFFLGLGVAAKPVLIDLHQDSPHIAESAGTGAGKSVLAQLIAVQVLARGGQVYILDIKGSHRWALGMPGVSYCTTAEQMHEALAGRESRDDRPRVVGLAELAARRNQDALHEEDGWDPGPRVLVLVEELNATTSLLRDYWARVRQPGQPKPSPAIEGLRFILFMGRSAKVNVLAVAQMLTALSTGGPEGRENFGIRCLARYTVNAWKMLVPEAAMPRASRTLGRWQVVIGGVAQETQVCYLSEHDARRLVAKYSPTGAVPWEKSRSTPIKGDSALGEPTDPRDELVTLRMVAERHIAPWAYEATKKRLQKARRAEPSTAPPVVGKAGLADQFRLGDVILWIESELVR